MDFFVSLVFMKLVWCYKNEKDGLFILKQKKTKKKKWYDDIIFSMEYHVYWSLKSSCFEIFGDGKYDFFLSQKFDENMFIDTVIGRTASFTRIFVYNFRHYVIREWFLKTKLVWQSSLPFKNNLDLRAIQNVFKWFS